MRVNKHGRIDYDNGWDIIIIILILGIFIIVNRQKKPHVDRDGARPTIHQSH